MRKLIVSMNMTLDGFMAGPNCELDWHFERWTPDMAASLCEQLSMTDTILLGRITYNAMSRYWPSKATDMSFPREDIAFAEMMNSHRKIVFSKTLDAPTWNNSRLVKRSTKKEILKLKNEDGKDMIVYGSSKLVSSLIEQNLVDDYALWIHPVVLGKGKPLFSRLHRRLNLQLARTQTFHSGVSLLYYHTISEA